MIYTDLFRKKYNQFKKRWDRSIRTVVLQMFPIISEGNSAKYDKVWWNGEVSAYSLEKPTCPLQFPCLLILSEVGFK